MNSRFTLHVSRLKRLLGCALVACLFLSACAGPPPQPLTFNSAPWSDGEVSTYDVRGGDGSLAGTASWTWQRSPEGWTQAYELNLGGRLDHGEVVVGPDLRPLRSWRELAGRRLETTYAADSITIATIVSGTTTTKELRRPADGLDNDQSLQVQRALPLVAGYVTRYTDVIPTTGLTAPIRLTVTGAETITVPAGTFPAWHTVLDYGSGKHDAWYEQQAPYPLVKYVNRASGAAFELRSITAGGAAGAAPVQAGPPPLNVPFLVVAFLVQYPLMLLFPLLLGWWLRRRYGVGWGLFGAGALTFIASQVMHLPLNWALGLLGGGRGVALWPLVPLALVAGLSAGVCEEGARWLVLRFFLKRARGWREALQFGAGHGGIEAIIFGLLALWTLTQMIALRSRDLAALGLTGATADQVRAALAQFWGSPWYMPVLAGLERLFAITFHIAMAVLVMRAITRRNIGYLAAAIAAHAALDFWAVWAMRTLGTTWTEVGVGVIALAALGLIIWLRQAPPPPEPPPAPAPVPTAADLAPRELSPEELARRAEESKYE
jgi:uncharacterized membrane protein YhfC